jgi:squalene-associated FAD-dependent desaturase
MSGARDDSVLIAGAGLAGLTAGYRLQHRGYSVQVFEKKPHAGGRVYSFEDDRTGDAVDNGQHVYLGCCRSLLDLLQELDVPVRDQLQDQLELTVRTPEEGNHHLCESSWLPYPLHLLPVLLNASFLSWADRYRIAQCFLSIYAMSKTDRKALDHRTMASWLQEHNQSEHAIQSFWNIFIISTLNAPAKQVSAASAIFVFQEGLMSTKDAGRIGYADRGQSPFYIDPLIRAFQQSGGTLSRRSTVRKLCFEGDRCHGVELKGGEYHEASSVIVTLPPWALTDISGFSHFPSELQTQIQSFQSAPIICVNFWLDSTILDESFVALTDATFDWVFQRNRIENRQEAVPQHLTLVKSAAYDELTHSPTELQSAAEQDLSRLYPGFDPDTVSHARVTKEPRATFVPEPGITVSRPDQDPSVDGLYLAGAWTNTGWPSTMESAVRSGERVASCIAGNKP